MAVQNPTCIEHEVRDPILVANILEDQIRKQETVATALGYLNSGNLTSVSPA